MFAGKTYWLIGASEGLGRALSHELDAAGATLILSARNGDRLDGLARGLANATALPLDVTDEASVRAAAQAIGGIDAILYCAGAYEPVKATDWNADAVIGMAEVNFLGALRVLGAALPLMLAKAQGRIILIGSLAGSRGLPGAIGYGASKAALMHLAENLRADLRDTPIKVQCVNPGFIKTRLTAKNDSAMPFIMTPEACARRVVTAIRSGRFSTSFPAPFSWLFLAGRYLPIGLFQRIVARKS